MPSPTEIADEFVVDDLEVLKAIAHSTRLDILQSLKHPKTVKEIAQRLNMAATKLYYHVNLMEKHELIQVVETNIVSGIIEKKYQVTARNYRLQDGLLTESNTFSEEIDMMLRAIFDTTRTELKRSIEAEKMKLASEDKRGLVWHSGLCLTPTQFAEFHKQLEELLRTMEEQSKQYDAEDGDDADSDANLYRITVAFYPFARPGEEEEEA
jgi:DNA-binding transcriptional ArsR family regulator